MTARAPTSLRVTQTMRADPARIYRAWTEPEQLARWWRMDQPEWEFVEAKVDVRPGGTFRLAMRGPDGKTHAAIGTYRDVEPPHRLSFSFDWEDPTHAIGETLVTVTIERLDSDSTSVTITHERFNDASRVAGHRSGWQQLLTLLDHAMTELQP
jgi:uncharacterized protein YndB with AHSA1/START domain